VKGFMNRLAMLEPAVLRGVIIAIIWVLTSFGIAISPQVPDSLIALSAALLALIQALWTRPSVTANARVAVLVPDPINAPEVVTAGAAVTTASNADIIQAAQSAGDENEPTRNN
jgi:hypothetical protein